MKDIIKEMRDCAKCLRDTPAFSDIPDHVAKAMDRWASRLESMQPAAGPRRTDVENAPKDGRRLLIFSKHDGAMHVARWSPMDDCFVSDHDGHHFAHSIYAFAELNPYQPEDAAHE